MAESENEKDLLDKEMSTASEKGDELFKIRADLTAWCKSHSSENKTSNREVLVTELTRYTGFIPAVEPWTSEGKVNVALIESCVDTASTDFDICLSRDGSKVLLSFTHQHPVKIHEQF